MQKNLQPIFIYFSAENLQFVCVCVCVHLLFYRSVCMSAPVILSPPRSSCIPDLTNEIMGACVVAAAGHLVRRPKIVVCYTYERIRQ